MQQVYHSNATTNINIRTQIQSGRVTNSELASRFNVSQQTVSKWRNRDFAEDVPSRPHNIRYALTDLERAIAISLRHTPHGCPSMRSGRPCWSSTRQSPEVPSTAVL